MGRRVDFNEVYKKNREVSDLKTGYLHTSLLTLSPPPPEVERSRIDHNRRTLFLNEHL